MFALVNLSKDEGFVHSGMMSEEEKIGLRI
jgi:hypothetical protein